MLIIGCGGSGNSPSEPDFSISVSTPSVFVPLGIGGGTQQVSIRAVNGFSQPVSVSLAGLPAGVTSSPASPFMVNPGSNQTVTLTAASNTPQGVQNITVNGSSGTLDHAASFSLSVANPSYVYLVTGAPNLPPFNLVGFAVDANTGNLVQVPGSPVALSGVALDLAVASESGGGFVYVLIFNSNTQAATLSEFAVDAATGKLTAGQSISFAAGAGQSNLSVDPAGKFLYLSQANSVQAYTIDPTTGNLVSSSVSSNIAGQVIVAPPGSFAFSPGASGNMIRSYSVNANTGLLTQLSSVVGTGGMLFTDPGGRAVYQLGSMPGGCGSFTDFRINTRTGALTNLNTTFIAPCAPQSMAFNLAGSAAYVSSTKTAGDTRNGIYGGSVNSVSGDLVNLVGSPFAVNSGAMFGAVEASTGKFIVEFTNSLGTNPQLLVYAINANTGGLMQVSGAQGLVPSQQISVNKMFAVAPAH
jgi:6-phosphogluconolactonase (cycloisomerase 2 family)